MDIDQLIKHIIEPSIKSIDKYSKDAVYLLVGTCAAESQLAEFVKQIGGPALGIYQMEPKTYYDIIDNYIQYDHSLTIKIFDTEGVISPAETLIYDLKLSTIFARLQYARFKEPLPAWNNFSDQAVYWKKYYNTAQGKGTVEKYLNANPFYKKNEK